MPVFEIESDAGKFQVDAPDQASALAALQQHTKPEAETTLAGVGKAALSGAIGGVADLAGLPADALGMTGIKGSDDFQKAYGSEALRQGITNKTGYQFHNPENFVERVASTGGSFLPNLIGGGAGMATKLATRVALPAVAAEVTGELTDQNPYAKTAAALVGGAGGLRAERALNRPAMAAVPTADDIAASTRQGYNTPAVRQAEYRPQSANALADDIQNRLRQSRISEKQAPQVYDAVDGLRQPMFGANHRIQDFDETRRLLNQLAGSVTDPVQAGAAQRAIRSIDAFTMRPPTGDALDDAIARQAGRDISNARASAAAGFRSERLMQAMERATNTAGATHSGGNLQNELQKAARTILNNPKQLRGFNEAERDALRQIARGTVAGSVIRRIAKVLGGGGGLGQLASGSAGAAMFGPVGAVAMPALGMLANRAGAGMAQRQFNQLDALVRSRAPSYAPGQAGYLAAQRGPGLLGSIPSPMQATVYSQLMAQRPQLVDGNR